MGTVGPASVDSLFGPTDPALPAQIRPAGHQGVRDVGCRHRQRQRVSRPLTWLEAASGIEDYLP